MRRFMSLAVGCCLLSLASVPGAARIGPVDPDLPALCDRADLIVVGRASAVGADGATTLVDNGATYPARLMVVDLQVERALKGTATGHSVTFTFAVPTVPVVGVGGVGVASGQFGIFILRGGLGGYEVLDPYYPFIVAVPGAPQTSGSLVDQVTAEVAYVLDSPAASATLKHRAVSVLASSRTPVATAALRTAARNQPLEIRLAAIAVLLARNDISFLTEAEEILLRPPPGVDQNLLAGLASAVGSGVKDARAIPSLARLLRAKDLTLRRGAVTALRNTRDGAAIDPLAQALYDGDPEVQYQAVIGLAEITGAPSEWSPASETFQNDPQRYLEHWRDWAKATK